MHSRVRERSTKMDAANSALGTLAMRGPSKGEKWFNKSSKPILGLGEKGKSVSDSDSASEMLVIVKDQLSNYQQTSTMIVAALEVVASAHPFMDIAVNLFKTALKMEQTRRENDARILTLKLAMCDTMQTLSMVQHLADIKAPAPGGEESIEDRLGRRMDAPTEAITSTARVCFNYKGRPVIVKYLTSRKWQDRFTGLAGDFRDLKHNFQEDMQLQNHLVTSSIHKQLKSLSDGMDRFLAHADVFMGVVFAALRPSDEKDLDDLVPHVSTDGVNTQDPDRLERLLARLTMAAGAARETVGAHSHAASLLGKGNEKLTVSELRSEIMKSVDVVLSENKTFDEKFISIHEQIKDVKGAVMSTADRIIDAYHAGPHKRIQDADVARVWEENAYKESVKARHLVIALNAHFSRLRTEKKDGVNDQTEQALIVKSDIAGGGEYESPFPSPTNTLHLVTAQVASEHVEAWALPLITVVRLRPLIEAIDSDISSFVTVEEMNAFTSAKPDGWSLQRWLAYWTYGFEMTVQWYFRRIRKLLLQINYLSRECHPQNRRTVDSFITTNEIRSVEHILSGLRNVEEWDFTDWNNDPIFLKFKGYIDEQERQMEAGLQRFKYVIDDKRTLEIITKGERLDKYMLPLIFLLMRRAAVVAQEATKTPIHPREFLVIEKSLDVLIEAVQTRARTLKAVFRLQDLNENAHLEQSFYGLYSFVLDEPRLGPVWTRHLKTDALALSGGSKHSNFDIYEDLPKIDLVAPVLCTTVESMPTFDTFYVPPLDDIVAIPLTSLIGTPFTSESSVECPLLGKWYASFTYSDPTSRDSPIENGLAEFAIHVEGPDGTFEGRGLGDMGSFAIHGSRRKGGLTFVKENHTRPGDKMRSWKYEGACISSDEIVGLWGFPDCDWGSALPFTTEFVEQLSKDGLEGLKTHSVLAAEAERVSNALGDFFGTFRLKRSSIEDGLAAAQPRTRRLWDLAVYSTVPGEGTRQNRLKKYLADRRGMMRSRRYMELINIDHNTLRGFSSTEREEWKALVQSVHPYELHLWRSIAQFRRARDVWIARFPNIVHEGITCDGCRVGPISPTRFVCIVCSKSEVMHSLNLCHTCFAGKVASRSLGPKVHSPEHSVLQLRSVQSRMTLHTMFSTAEYYLSVVEVLRGNLSGIRCDACSKPILDRPYWYCIDCTSYHVCICTQCNEAVEDWRPWLYQTEPNCDFHDKHDWSHTLFFVPRQLPRISDEGKIDGEDRLTRLNAKVEEQSLRLTELQNMIKGMKARMDAMHWQSMMRSPTD